MINRLSRTQRLWLVGGLLCLLTLATYWPVFQHGFISYDDADYVTENAHVQAGLTWEGVSWAFRSTEAANWHPLTWLSHMLDVQLFGAHAGGHHFTSLLLHLANTVLVLLLLERLTGRFWRSALVAALFALHPLHVESVAWVAERKDVLSACFFLLTLCAYARYAQSPAAGQPQKGPPASPAGTGTRHKAWYILSLLLFSLGLLSKPMVVTLPFVLLLLDYWPLGRWENHTAQLGSSARGQARAAKTKNPWANGWPLVWEKLPFFALTFASCGITLLAQGRGGTVSSLHDYPLSARLTDVAAAYLQYLGKMLYPLHLAVFYPHPASDHSLRWAGWQLALAVLVLLAVTLLAWRRRHSAGWFLTGWLWFLGMLVPVIGLVQVGTAAMADRYSYLPLVGIFVVVVWGIGTWCEARMRTRPREQASAARAAGASPNAPGVGWRQAWVACLAAAILLGCAGLSRRQVGFWQDDFTLFEHALSVTERNAPAHASLGLAWGRKEKYGFAVAHCRAALQADPHYPAAWHTLGDLNTLLGKLPEAMRDYRTALKWKPNSAWSWFKLGLLNAQQNNLREAEADYRTALKWKPDMVEAHTDLGALLISANRREAALPEFELCVHLQPKDARTHYNLGTTLADLGRLPEAEAQLRAALQLQPHYLEASAALAGVLAQSRRPAEATALVETLNRECANDGKACFQLGSALWNANLTNAAANAFAQANRLQPALPQILLQVAQSLAAKGQLDDAVRQLRILLVLQPNLGEAHQRLGLLLANQGKLEEAAAELRETLRLAPTAGAHYDLALVLGRAGKSAEAAEQYSLVLQAKPDFAPALNDLAWLRATAAPDELRNGAEAVRLAERCCQLTNHRNAGFLATLAAAYAEANRFDEAIAAAQRAQALATATGDQSLITKLTSRLALYQQHRPCRQ